MIPKSTPKGRGAVSNRTGRFESWDHEEFQDGWYHEELPVLKTTIEVDNARSVIARNQSPDLSFDQSINMYRGCEHGCTYCYARPSHTYLGYSAGLDFETKLFAKYDVAEKLTKEITARSYQCQEIALGSNTDPYQPIEKNLRLTRQILEVLLEYRHPVQITTKSASIVRDMDVLAQLAQFNLVNVNISITSLDASLTRRLEPRASAPHSRLKAVSQLCQHQIPITIFVAPVIPGLNDHEIEAILESSAQAGARRAEWTMIRLPLEVADLFREWLMEYYPHRETRVMSLIRQVRGGRTNRSDFFERMRGTGPIAEMIQKRFMIAIRKFGLDLPPVELEVARFRKSAAGAVQMSLFD